jgi:hypothetical protein
LRRISAVLRLPILRLPIGGLAVARLAITRLGRSVPSSVTPTRVPRGRLLTAAKQLPKQAAALLVLGTRRQLLRVRRRARTARRVRVGSRGTLGGAYARGTRLRILLVLETAGELSILVFGVLVRVALGVGGRRFAAGGVRWRGTVGTVIPFRQGRCSGLVPLRLLGDGVDVKPVSVNPC